MTFKLRTAPAVRSDTIVKLERIGKTAQLLQAIEAERRNISNTGNSANGEITVKRVGGYDQNGSGK